MDAFLTREEKKQLQRMYEKWNKHVQPHELVQKLYTKGLINDREIGECDAKLTIYDKNKYLYDAVLSRSTYDNICKMKAVLLEMGDVHSVLADLLPQRQEQYQYNDNQSGRYSGNTEQPEYSGGSYNHGSEYPRQGSNTYDQNRNNSARYDQTETGHNQKFHTPYDTSDRRNEPSKQNPPGAGQSYMKDDGNEHFYDPKYAYGHVPRSNNFEQQSSDSFRPTGEAPTYASRPTGEAPTHASRPTGETPTQSTNIHDEVQSDAKKGLNNQRGVARKKKLNVYQTRPNNPKSGDGLCVIIANFTDHLLGYNHDIKLITDFFGKTLGYTVLGGEDGDTTGFRNLTTKECKDKMTELKTELESGQYKNCDRFFLFALSHGDELGIKMVPPNDKDNPVRDRISSEYLVETFAHGQLPNLKGFPKCFFIQVCSGDEIAQAAHSSPNEEEEISKSRVVAVGADTLVCHASKMGKYSWVSQGESAGSWFLQATMEVFSDFYESEHVLDMLTEVNDKVSKQQGIAVVKDKSSGGRKKEKVFQIPAISNNLTKKLYFVT